MVGFRYDYWGTWDEYHKPKYQSFKMELLSNKIYSIDTNLFNYVYNKSQFLYHNSDYIKSIQYKSSIDQVNNIYGIKHGQSLSIMYIMSIIFYTDFDVLSYNFRSTFRRIFQNETARSVKKRNTEYWYWSKLLMETVNCFGTRVAKSKINTFYHNTSLVHFDSFIAEFNSPTSTTSHLSIATLYGKNDGLILDLKMYNNAFNGIYGKSLRYFNCEYLSSFNNQNERLFICPPHNIYGLYLEIASIHNTLTNKNYGDFIQSLSLFDNAINGINADSMCNLHSFSYGMISENKGRIWDLISYTIQNIENNNQLPLNWIQQCFIKWTENKFKIHFDLNELRNLYPKIAEYFTLIISNKNNIHNLLSFDKINVIFKNVEEIDQWNTGYVNSDYIYGLLSVVTKINKINKSKLYKICLWGVENIDAFPDLVKYQSIFTDKHWKFAKEDQILTLMKCV